MQDFKDMFNEMASYNAWCMKRCLPDGVTTPAPESTTPKTKSDCCNKLELRVDDNYYVNFLEGFYEFTGTVNGHEYWIHSGGNYALWYTILDGWRGSYLSSLGGTSGFIFGPETSCPTDEGGWSHYDNTAIVESGSGVKWECLGIQILTYCNT